MEFCNSKKELEIGCVTVGEVVDVIDVDEPVFKSEMLGKGVGIIPNNGHICAPCDGVITMVFPTLHSFEIVSFDGVEILVHIGFDTVSLKGKGFKLVKEQGSKVKKGDLIIEADLNYIKSKGLNNTIILVVTNNCYKKMEKYTGVKSLSDSVINLLLK